MIFIFIILLLLIILRIVKMFTYQDNKFIYKLYFGKPRSGKTTFAVKEAYRLKKKGIRVLTNDSLPLKSIDIFKKSHIGYYDFGAGSVLVFDEGSLNGYDNRQFKFNFTEESLSYFKLIGHYKNKMIFTNQGYEELDKKIRLLTDCLYYVRKIGCISYAIKIKPVLTIDNETHQIIEGYRKPFFFEYIFFSDSIIACYRPKYYNKFDSFCKPVLPEF